jgi:hypothetical protein
MSFRTRRDEIKEKKGKLADYDRERHGIVLKTGWASGDYQVSSCRRQSEPQFPSGSVRTSPGPCSCCGAGEVEPCSPATLQRGAAQSTFRVVSLKLVRRGRIKSVMAGGPLLRCLRPSCAGGSFPSSPPGRNPRPKLAALTALNQTLNLVAGPSFGTVVLTSCRWIRCIDPFV